MPYIKKKDRKELDNRLPKNAGELQYLMAVMFKEYLYSHGNRYQTMNDVMGALAGAQQEFYRKVVAPYEDKKIAENGGLYEIG